MFRHSEWSSFKPFEHSFSSRPSQISPLCPVLSSTVPLFGYGSVEERTLCGSAEERTLCGSVEERTLCGSVEETIMREQSTKCVLNSKVKR